MQFRSRQQLAVALAQRAGVGDAGSLGARIRPDRVIEEMYNSDALVPSRESVPRMVETILSSYGLVYDPYWDTTEARGDGTVEVCDRFFSRMLCAISSVPRCFLLNVSDSGLGSHWERDHENRYRYSADVSGFRLLNQAGPGARVIYYATSRAARNPRHFVASAEVSHIEATASTVWEATIDSYLPFESPVGVDELNLPGWNRQHAITEISARTFDELVEAGGAIPAGDAVASPDHESGVRAVYVDTTDSTRLLESLRSEFPITRHVRRLVVPPRLPQGRLSLTSAPQRTSGGDASSLHHRPSAPVNLSPQQRSRARDRAAEVRAIEIATVALEMDGWNLARDCQAEGVGYDLEFERGESTLKVEVKGVQGRELAFNLTPKELERAVEDEAWVLIAVLSVLSPTEFHPRLVTRDRVVSAPRAALGYRITIPKLIV